ncbi:hypothetical protein [Streptomyces sp. NPDC002566]|uniref:hypothetical protein n=1 Tax=Streptomyces sp. NPDC002566 TaxID=3364650 RepID=UPI0036CC7703
MPNAGRAAGVAATTAVTAAWSTAAASTGTPALVVGAPVLGALWLLVVLDSGYLLGREWAHRRRRRADASSGEAWTPPPQVRRPLDHPGVIRRPAAGTLNAHQPVDLQGRYRATGIRLAVLPALAVTFLTVQTVLLPQGGDLGRGFVLAEVLLLLAMIWTVWRRQEPSRPWVVSRTRTELFRREMFLIVAQAGPYLGLAPDDVPRTRDARLSLIAASDPARLDQLLYLRHRDDDGSERHWRDEVWRRPGPADADTVERMRTYLDHRIRRQARYFRLAADKCDRAELRFGAVAKGTVVTAVAVALGYAVFLTLAPGTARPTVSLVIALLAAGLPPLCNSVLAVQNLLAFQRLSVSYRETRQELLGHENTLRRLIADHTAEDRGAAFRALALAVESTLTEEHRRWRIIVAKPEFDAGL